MEKKRSLKARFMAGGLALFLAMGAGTSVALAKGEENNYDGQATTVPTCAIKDQIIALHEHKYASEDGKIEKWICSEEEQLDGLYWSEEQRPLGYSLEKFNKKNCDIEEKHYHLCAYSIRDGKVSETSTNLPIKCDDKIPERFPNKTPIIIKLEDSEDEIIRELYLMRIEDSILLYDDMRLMGIVGESYKCLMIKVENKGNEFVISEIVTNDIEKYIDEYPYADYNHNVAVDEGYTPVEDKHVLRLEK